MTALALLVIESSNTATDTPQQPQHRINSKSLENLHIRSELGNAGMDETQLASHYPETTESKGQSLPTSDVLTPKVGENCEIKTWKLLKENGGDDGARTRDLRRDRPAF